MGIRQRMNSRGRGNGWLPVASPASFRKDGSWTQLFGRHMIERSAGADYQR